MAEFCEVSGGDDWDTFTEYMFTPSDGGVQNRVASDTFMTKYLNETILDNDAPDAGRFEKVEKTVKDMCGMHAVLRYLFEGFTPTNNNTNWDKAAAVYYGHTYTGSLSHRANYLGGQFNTMVGSNSDTNWKINNAFTHGKDSSTEVKEEQYEIIEHQMRIVYTQGIIKYAHKVDKAVADGSATAYMEAQAEGQAFARILAPWVHKRSENNATALEYMFDTSEEPRGYAHYNYCAAKAILQADINGGISDDEIGYYDNTEEIVCPTIDKHLDTFSRDSTDTYTPTSIVGPDLSVSQAVAKVKALLGDSSDYAAIKAEYTNRAYARWLILIARESQFGIYSSHTLVPRRGFLTLSIKSAMAQFLFAPGARAELPKRLSWTLAGGDRQRSLSRILEPDQEKWTRCGKISRRQR